MNKTWMTPSSETQIVAFLLLFFLAHLALGECNQYTEVEINFACALENPKLEKPYEWKSSPDGKSVCVSRDFSTRYNSFTLDAVKVFRVKNQTPREVAYVDSIETIAQAPFLGIQGDDGFVRLKISREGTKGRSGYTTNFRTRAVLSVQKLKPDNGVFNSFLKGEPLEGIPDQVVEGNSGTLTVTTPLKSRITCTFGVNE